MLIIIIECLCGCSLKAIGITAACLIPFRLSYVLAFLANKK